MFGQKGGAGMNLRSSILHRHSLILLFLHCSIALMLMPLFSVSASTSTAGGRRKPKDALRSQFSNLNG